MLQDTRSIYKYQLYNYIFAKYLSKDVYLEYIKNIYNSITRKSHKNVGKRIEHF